jgi:hypothetical protein
MSSSTSFSFEQIARRSINYYENMVDASGLPYFNIFWTTPPEAAHDWPDFGDVMPRQLQAAVMLRRMTGSRLKIEPVWLEKICAMISQADGCLYRPKTGFSESERHFGDAALTLYALATAALDSKDEKLVRAACAMCDGMFAWKRDGDIKMPVEWAVFAVKSLMICARSFKSRSALDLAGRLITEAFGEGGTYLPDNKFRGHMHGGLRGLVGAADYALHTGDAELFDRVHAFYRDIRDRLATSFGFIPEDADRKGDVVGCETCALMDYAGLGVTLANHGHPEIWGDMERLARNHLVESQAVDCSWLGKSPGDKADDEQFSWTGIAERVSGAWAGWSSPTHILACRETLNAQWGGPELKNKARALQNCCGGSGVHALFLLWKNSARFAHGTLRVNMHTDKLLPQAEIRCLQPYEGKLRIILKEACDLSVRIPDFARSAPIAVAANHQPAAFERNEHDLFIGNRQAGDIVEISYPLEIRHEQVAIGNPEGRKFTYNVTWKGDTVVEMTPNNVGEDLVYSDFEKTTVPGFYGESGPGRLYQRSHYRSPVAPEPLPLHEDDGELNLWEIEKE